jgi:hypothetical protein
MDSIRELIRGDETYDKIVAGKCKICGKEYTLITGSNRTSRKDGKDSFSVELLFEKDGVKVYRFIDGDEYRYFSIGNGSFQPQEQKIVVSNGKTTTVYHNYDGASGN